VDGRGTPGVRFTVADTGEGISPDCLPRIFDRFARSDSDGTDRSGFGLGLAIVRELVALHNGEIRVSSQPGAGTTFVVDLPAAPPTGAGTTQTATD
jgi:signal transduction histidine kinase